MPTLITLTHALLSLSALCCWLLGHIPHWPFVCGVVLKPFGNYISNLFSKQKPDNVQRHIDPRRDSCRRDDLAIVNVAFALDLDLLELPQRIQCCPVGGGVLSVKQACRRKDQSAGTHRGYQLTLPRLIEDELEHLGIALLVACASSSWDNHNIKMWHVV